MEVNPYVIDKINKIIKGSKDLQRKGRLNDALNKVTQYGQDEQTHPESWRISKQIIKLNNIIASKQLQSKQSVPYLREAEAQFKLWKMGPIEKLRKLQLITYNNWATFHQQAKSFHMSIKYLLQAQKICDEEITSSDPEVLKLLAKTKLNLSALYIELRRFKDAREFAEQSLAIIQGEVNTRLQDKDLQDLEEKECLEVTELITTMVIAFYNVGAAAEAMSQFECAIEAYRNASNLGMKYLDNDLEIVKLSKRAFDEARMQNERSFRESQSSLSSRSRMSNSSSSLVQPHGRPLLLKSKSTKSNIALNQNSLPQVSQTPVGRKLSLVKSNSTQRNVKKLKRKAHLVGQLSGAVQKMKHDKYYTERELELLTRKLETKDNFINTDQYFSKKINKMMNIQKDIVHLKPKFNGKSYQEDDENKRIMAKLTLRRHTKIEKAPIKRGAEYVKERIERLRHEEAERQKLLEIAHKSREASKQKWTEAAKKRQRYLPTPTKSHEPAQRLFFRPPGGQAVEDQVIQESEKKRSNFDMAKDGIESLMEHVQGEIRFLTEKQRFKPLRTTASQEFLETERAQEDDAHTDLAESTAGLSPRHSPRQGRRMTTYPSFLHLVEAIDKKNMEKEIAASKRRATLFRPDMHFGLGLLSPSQDSLGSPLSSSPRKIMTQESFTSLTLSPRKVETDDIWSHMIPEHKEEKASTWARFVPEEEPSPLLRNIKSTI